jgi:hypothetical protein
MGLTLIEFTLVLLGLVGWIALSMTAKSPLGCCSNDRNASGSLKQMGSIEVTFKSSDSDGSGINDHYTADVAGLYHMPCSEWRLPIRMVERSVADADGAPAADYGSVAAPKVGFWYFAQRGWESPDGWIRFDGARSIDRFSFITVPARPGSSGRFAFMISENGTMLKLAPETDRCFLRAPRQGTTDPGG